MRILLLIILIAIQATVVHAQNSVSVSGTVTDTAAAPLEGITIQLYSLPDSIIVSLKTTDSKGYYKFPLMKNNNYFIKASGVGYKSSYTQSFRITSDSNAVVLPKIILFVQEAYLKDVKVIASTNTIQAKEGKLIYNIDKSITAAGSTAFELVQKTPGVKVDADENLSLKGSTQINIMVDGKMTYLSSQQLTTYLKSLPAENLTRIEIITAPSSEFDAAGNAGIINIVTKKMNREGYALNVSAGFGAGKFVQHNEGFVGNIRTSKLNFFGSYNHSFNHSYLDRTSFRTISTNGKLISYDRLSFDPSYANYNNYKAGVDFYLNKKTEMGFVYTGASNRWERNSAGPTYLRNASGKVDSVVQNKNITIEPAHDNAYNFNFKTSLDTLGKQITFDGDYASYNRNSTGSLGNGLYTINGAALQPYQLLAFQQPGKITIRSIKADVALPFKKLTWKGGVKYASVRSDNNFVYDSLINGVFVYSKTLSNHFIYDEKIYAAYISFNKPLHKTLTMDAGVRVERTKSNGNSITSAIETKRVYTNPFPYLSFTKKLSGNNSLNVSLTRRINRPVYANLNPFRYFFDKYSYVEGNPYLQPELSWNMSAAYTFKQNYIITANYSRTSNAMLGFALQDSATGVLRISTFNFSHKNAADILFVIPVKPTSFWSIQNTVDVSYLHYLYTAGKEIFAPKRVSVDVEMVHSFTLPKAFRAELTVHYTSPSLSGVYVLQPYFQTDAGVKKIFFKSKLSAGIVLNDVFKTDRYWGYSIYKATNVRYDHCIDSRRIKLSLSYHFGGKLSAGKERRLDEQERL